MGSVTFSEEEYQKKMCQLNNTLAIPAIDSLHQINKNIIMSVLSVLKKNGISCFLDFNSLLGKVRDNGYIPWTNSVNVSAINEVLPCENFIAKIKQSLTDHYINEKYYENMLCSFIILDLHGDTKTIQPLIDHKNKIFWDIKHLNAVYRSSLPFRKFEISTMVKLNDNWGYQRNGKISNKVKPIPDNDIFPLKACNLNGINTFMPNKSEKHLQRLYGDNWRKPTTKIRSKLNQYKWQAHRGRTLIR